MRSCGRSQTLNITAFPFGYEMELVVEVVMQFRVQALACNAPNQQPKGWTLNLRLQTASVPGVDVTLVQSEPKIVE
jgi:hypothetical protein